jgi:hypothetical protein
VSLDRIERTGLPGNNSNKRAVDNWVWAEELEQDIWDRTAGTGEPGQDNQDRTCGMGQLGKDSQDKTAGTGPPGQHCQDRKAGIGELGQSEKTAGIVRPG